MKISNFGNIIKKSKKKYLEENYLSSEYTWGFELEGFVRNSLTLDDFLMDSSFSEFYLDDIDEKNYNGDISDEAYECAKKIKEAIDNHESFDDVKEYFDNERFMNEIYNYHDIDLSDRTSFPDSDFQQVDDILYDTFKKYISEGNWSKMTGDGSLEADYDNDYAFEYNTPAMPFTPSVINDVIHMFAELENTGFYINDTCGFHIHLSYPNIKRDDLIWVLCCLAMDEDALNKISYLENSGIKLFKEGKAEYGTIDTMKDLKHFLETKNWAYVSEALSVEKMTVFRIHPQGTLEWRGPRNFLNEEGDNLDLQNLYDLFKNLYKLTQFISNSLNKKFIEINGEMISKQEVMKNILSQPKGISVLKLNSDVEKKTWDKYSKIYSELLKNKFDENYLKKYLNKPGKVIEFINWLKVRLSEYPRRSELNWLFEYFKTLKEDRILYPYAYELMDCIENLL